MLSKYPDLYKASLVYSVSLGLYYSFGLANGRRVSVLP